MDRLALASRSRKTMSCLPITRWRQPRRAAMQNVETPSKRSRAQPTPFRVTRWPRLPALQTRVFLLPQSLARPGTVSSSRQVLEPPPGNHGTSPCASAHPRPTLPSKFGHSRQRHAAPRLPRGHPGTFYNLRRHPSAYSTYAPPCWPVFHSSISSRLCLACHAAPRPEEPHLHGVGIQI